MVRSLAKFLDPRSNAAATAELVELSWRHRELVSELARREVLDRYAGQALGKAWAVLNPLLLMGVYVFAFTVLFRSRMSASGSPLEYAAYVLSALAPWVAASDVLAKAPTAVSGNANLVKQIVFPNQILALKVTLGTLPSLLIGVAVALAVAYLSGRGSVFSPLLAIVPVACFILMLGGLAYLIAAIGVFMRDVRDLIGILLSIGLFLHPIAYAPGVAPRFLEWVFLASPLTYVLLAFRDAVFYGAVTRPWIWIIQVVLSVLIFSIGYRIYRMLQPSFGNAL